MSVDPDTLLDWLSARSVARGLPAPVRDHGGFRVDTNSEAEVARWVFARVTDDVARLARSITGPRRFIKACTGRDELAAALPPGWTLEPSATFMQATTPPPRRALPAGYRIAVDRAGGVIEVRVLSQAGALAARGFAAETPRAFVYDRIATAPDHRRKGLGHMVMQTLHDARRKSATPELLIATDAGKALYATLGWKAISAYSTATLPGESQMMVP